MDVNFLNYKIGIKKLLEVLNKHHPKYDDVLAFQIQLIDNIKQIELFGDSENLRHDRNRILTRINSLVSEITEREKTFLDFCKSTPIRISSNKSSQIEQSVQYEFQETEMCLVSKSPFIMGSPSELDSDAFEDEFPLHIVDLTAFYIASKPVTNLQYAIFIANKSRDIKPPQHWNCKFPDEKIHNHPVVNVSLDDAISFCNWLSELTYKPYRLPTEAEWEKAARGVHGSLFPWGNTWKTGYANTRELNKGEPVSVENFPNATSPYGLLNAVGNIYEWTISLWGYAGNKPRFSYPYISSDGREVLDAPADVLRVIRGGSFLREKRYARCSSRDKLSSSSIRRDVGFRLALSPID